MENRTHIKRVALACFLGLLLSASASAQTTLGAFVNTDGQDSWTEFTAFSSQVQTDGGTLSIDNNYYGFDWSQNPLARVSQDIQYGYTPMMSMSADDKNLNAGCVYYSDVANGVYDDTILKAEAVKVANLGATVMIRLFYEMTDSSHEICAYNNAIEILRPGLYTAAFTHVVDVFRAAGATNVVWVWAPGEAAYETINNGEWLNYYPGSSYVDIIAEDLYNKDTNPVSPTDPAQQFPGEVCSDAANMGKPLMISETGAVTGTGRQPEWLSTVKTVCPNLSYFLYWDATGKNPYEFDSNAVIQLFTDIGEPSN